MNIRMNFILMLLCFLFFYFLILHFLIYHHCIVLILFKFHVNQMCHSVFYCARITVVFLHQVKYYCLKILFTSFSRWLKCLYSHIFIMIVVNHHVWYCFDLCETFFNLQDRTGGIVERFVISELTSCNICWRCWCCYICWWWSG